MSVALAAVLEQATLAELRELEALDRQEAELRSARPLAWATLWHRDLPRTSQRKAAAVALVPDRLVTLVSGGNRAGKTDLGAQWAIAMAMGRAHPDVQEWGRRNGLDLSTIPRDPGVVWSVALTFPDSRRYVRDKLKKYAPVNGCRFRNWDAENEAELHLPGGGKVVCKAWRQGRDGMQGDSIRGLWADEEPDDSAAWNEALMRLADQRGRALLTFTPMRGLTWVYDRYVKETPHNVGYVTIHGQDNPHVPPEVLREILSGFGEGEQAARARGEWTQLEGLIYGTFRRDMHVIPSFPIPKEWRRYRSIDFGTRNPFCCLWGALDGDDRLHIYRIHHEAGQLLTYHAAVIHDLSGATATAKAIRDRDRILPPATGERFVHTIADPEDAGARRTLAAELGIETVAAQKAVTDGIRVVQERLRPQADGRPALFIHDCCGPLIQEISGYQWADKVAKEEPKKENDHAMDALRYLCMDVKPSAVVAPPPSPAALNARLSAPRPWDR